MRIYTYTHIDIYTFNGRLSLRVIEHIYTPLRPLRVSARDPRCARATNFLCFLKACGIWLRRLRRMALQALGSCSAGH